jgi:acetyl-CoA acetyltransferase family protein
MSAHSAPSQRLAIIDGRRTPFVKAGGRLKKVQADDLAVPVLRDAVDRTGMRAEEIDEVMLGCVCQPAHAANIARVSALRAGFPQAMPAMTVHRNCASGMEAITTAWERMRAGVIRTAVVGGTESMSNVPLHYGPEMTALFARLARAKTVGQRLGVLVSFRPRMLTPVIALQLGLTDPVTGCNMGITAENLANRFGISRAEQDAYALESHRRATRAQQQKVFADEILPWIDGAGCLHDDDGVRHDQTIAALEKLRPYFVRGTGTVTVGNACPVTDGA